MTPTPRSGLERAWPYHLHGLREWMIWAKGIVFGGGLMLAVLLLTGHVS